MKPLFGSAVVFLISLGSLMADAPPALPVGIGHVLYSAGSFPPIFSPGIDAEGIRRFWILTPDETTGVITFDASRSYHPEGKPLLCRWMTLESEQVEPVPGITWSASPYVTIPWRPNTGKSFYVNVVEMDADLRLTSGRFGKAVRVNLLSPAAVMRAMRESITDRFDTPRLAPDRIVRRTLLPSVDLAAEQFRAGNWEAAIKTVQLFQRQVKDRLRMIGPEFGETLIRLSQAVIDNVRMKYPAPGVPAIEPR